MDARFRNTIQARPSLSVCYNNTTLCLSQTRANTLPERHPFDWRTQMAQLLVSPPTAHRLQNFTPTNLATAAFAAAKSQGLRKPSKNKQTKKSELFWNIQYKAVEQHLLESARRVQWALRNPRVSVQWAARKGCFVPLPLQPHQGSVCWGVRLLLLGQAQWEARRSSQPPPAVRSAPQATN